MDQTSACALPRRLASLAEDARDPREGLGHATRCDVLFRASLRDTEAVTERGREVICRVTADGKARADLRPVGGERRDDHPATWSDRACQRLDVPLSIRLADEEVEDGAVVPEVVTPIRLPREDIRPDAPHGRVGG